MNILLTGATGFIGRNILKSLLDIPDNKITVFIRPKSRGKLSEIKSDYRIYLGDILNKNELLGAVKGQDVLIHCAGYVGKNKTRLKQLNVDATEIIAQCAREIGVKRLIYMSSVSVISANSGILKDDMPLNASNIYGLSKLEAEQIIWQYIADGGRAVILRPAMVYGKGEPHMLPKLVRLLKWRLFPLIGTAQNRWHLCAIENLVEAVKIALQNNEMLSNAYIVADEDVLTTREVIALLCKATGAKQPITIPKSLADVLANVPVASKYIRFFSKDRVYDISKLRETSWKPLVDSKSAIKNIFA